MPGKKSKILMLGTSLDTQGGVAAVVSTLNAGGFFKRNEVEYIATHRDGGLRTKLFTALTGWLRFIGSLLGRRVALVHVHMASRASFWRKFLFLLPAFALRVPVVLHLHGGEFREFYERESSPFAQRLIRFVFEHASWVVVLGTGWNEWVKDQFPQARVSVIYNPVVLHERTSDAVRDSITLLFLGRLGVGKGTFDLVESLARLVPAFPNVKLLLGGDGELDAVKERAAALGVASNVETLGWVRGEDKNTLLARASVYVLPSYNEGLPVSVLEAMAAGLPVVSTPVGGIPEAITDGVEGFLVQPGDVAALSERLGRLLGDPDLRHRMGSAARQKAETCFSVEKIVSQIEAVYRELLNGATTATPQSECGRDGNRDL